MKSPKVPRVFSIPPAENFLHCLTEALTTGRIIPNFPEADDPFRLARAVIFLPTRRACRALKDHLQQQGHVLLPRIRPLGDIDEAGLQLSVEEEDFDTASLPPAIMPLERQLILSRLILKWAKTEPTARLTPASPADSVYLAGELARLLDMVTNEGLPVSALRDLPPLDLQQHWQSAFNFLQIASEAWPQYLAAANRLEPTERRRRMMQAEAARLSQNPDIPVIAAGSTGSVPVTAEFLAAIARHPRGAVILPGLDRNLDEKSWRIIGGEPVLASHPQAAMAALLQRFKLGRDDVEHLGEDCDAPVRERVFSEVMRPAETSEEWAVPRFLAQEMNKAMSGVALVEAVNEHEEALAIACIMRETLEDPRATVALATPDRILARRVVAELKRFGIEVDDSAGLPLIETQAGIFARLVAKTASSKCHDIDCLSLLKHPLCRLSQSKNESELANAALERLLFRGICPAQGSESLLQKIEASNRAESACDVLLENRELAKTRLKGFCAAIADFEAALNLPAPQPLSLLLQKHLVALYAFACSPTEDAELLLKSSGDGAVLIEFMAALQEAGDDRIELNGGDYPEFLAAFAATIPVYPIFSGTARAHIYGLLEARLIRHNRLVLGGLNEGIWPAAGQTDLWMSRSMRASLNLPAPERRTGLSAHDFAQATGTRDIWMTRSLKTGGAPSVPSRFVQRLAVVAGDTVFRKMHERGDMALHYARFHNMPSDPLPQPAQRPMPAPIVEVRPRQLSLTEIETLLRDPYSIYARQILKLRALEPVGEEFGACQRGTLLHAILREFVLAIENGAAVSEETLAFIGEYHFRPYLDIAEVRVYWWPRFNALIPELVGFEKKRRKEATKIFTEKKGSLNLALPHGSFTLIARADRIEQKNGSFAIVDFKTGVLPKVKDINAYFALQLSLQAAMLQEGAFQGLKGTVDEALYIGLAKSDQLEERGIEPKDMHIFTQRSLDNVRKVLIKFDQGAPYISKADSPYAPLYSDYTHLARLGEWGLIETAEAE